MVYLCKATFGYKVLHRIQVGIAAFLKINGGVMWTSAEKSKDTKYYRTFTFGGSFFHNILGLDFSELFFPH